MKIKFTNNATSRLSSPITATATTLSVKAGEGIKFPILAAGEWFPVTVVKADGTLEIMRCTARTGDNLTVARGQENTTPIAFAVGDRVEVRLTENALMTVANEAVQDGMATDAEAAARTSKTKALTPYGLGLNLQSSIQDATAGKILTVGAFGLGRTGAGTADNWPTASLDDTDVPSGMYYVFTAEGKPTADAGVIWHRQTGSAGSQFFETVKGELFHRGRRSGAYTSWSKTLNVGEFGLGGGTVTPPNGKDGVNPSGWYYGSGARAPWGGGAFFLELPYGTAMNSGLRISTDPYTDDFYFNGAISGKKEYRPACKLWHDRNLNPADFQPKGNYQPAGNYQIALGYTPVNKAGDTMTGTLVSNANVEARNRVVAGGAWNDWATSTMLDGGSVWMGNAYNRFRFGREENNLALWRYTGQGAYQGRVFQVGADDVMRFDKIPYAAGYPLLTSTSGAGDIGTYGLFQHVGSAEMYPGHTVPGSELRYSNAYPDVSGWAPSGSWRLMGYVPGNSAQNRRISVWQRYA